MLNADLRRRNFSDRPDDSARLYLERARIAHHLEDFERELESLHQAASIAPLNQKLQRRLIELFISSHRFRDALGALADLSVAGHRTERDALSHVICLIGLGQFDRAEAMFQGLLNEFSSSTQIVVAWAEFLIDIRERPKDVISALHCRELETQPAEIHVVVAKALAAGGDEDRALCLLRGLTERKPDNDEAWLEIGLIERRLGNISNGSNAFARAAECNPGNMSALRMEASEHCYRYGDSAFKRITHALARSHKLANSSLIHLNYAAGKAYEDVGDCSTAFAHYERAGTLQRATVRWSPGPMQALLAHLRRHFTQDVLSQARQTGFETSMPVFVFGMPRSGTSLVEQIIASHPSANGSGELSLAAQVLDGVEIGDKKLKTLRNGVVSSYRELGTWADRGRAYGAALEKFAKSGDIRVVDKMPGNYAWLGPLDAALPHSHFIHCRRHPLDACLSMYKLYFGEKVPYSYDLRDLGRSYRLYLDFMAYWESILPRGRIFHIRYEDLVNDFATVAPGLIRHIGLAWNNRCERFHETRRTIRTASASQVRRPLYTSGIGQWCKFSDQLSPLIGELGREIAAYESELEEYESRETRRFQTATQIQYLNAREVSV